MDAKNPTETRHGRSVHATFPAETHRTGRVPAEERGVFSVHEVGAAEFCGVFSQLCSFDKTRECTSPQSSTPLVSNLQSSLNLYGNTRGLRSSYRSSYGNRVVRHQPPYLPGVLSCYGVEPARTCGVFSHHAFKPTKN